MDYYYFVASLPLLSLEGPPPLSSEDFLSMCDRLLRPQDSETMRSLSADPVAEDPSPFAQAWRDREIQLRNALVRIRAARMGRDASPYLRVERTVDAAVEKVATDAFSRPNPGEREREIDQFRWRQLEDLAGLGLFSESVVFAYGLKLKILERWATVDASKGQEIVEAIVTRLPASKGPNRG